MTVLHTIFFVCNYALHTDLVSYIQIDIVCNTKFSFSGTTWEFRLKFWNERLGNLGDILEPHNRDFKVSLFGFWFQTPHILHFKFITLKL